MKNQISLETPLLQFAGEDASSAFTIRNACEGFLVTGNTGTGKSSGSGHMISMKYLRAGFGGLVLCAKPDEAEIWLNYCKQAGREQDLIIVKPGSGHYFNFLEYESTVRTETSYAHNLLQLLKTVIEAGEERANNHGSDSFWQNALELFLINLINLSLLAYGSVTVQRLYDLAQSAPRADEQVKRESEGPTAYEKAMKIAKATIRERLDAWKKTKTVEYIESLSESDFEDQLAESIPDYRTLMIMHQFFSEGLYRISSRTRGIIDFTLLAFLHRLLSDPIYSLFCHHPSTFTPESCLDGKIIVIDLPVKLYDKAGQDAQTLVKYVFQKSWERRDLSVNERPVFLWADEAQFFLTPYDTTFQTTARSSRVAVVYLSQNLPGFYANMGGDGRKSEYKVKSFLATLSTKIFHANNDVDTNEWASSLIGQAYTKDVSRSVNMGSGFSISDGASYSLEYMVRPEAFSKLATGGYKHNGVVEAYIHCQGTLFNNKTNHLKIQFQQELSKTKKP